MRRPQRWRLHLPIAASLGISQALVMCDTTNAASKRVIEVNGGRLLDITKHKLRYWGTDHAVMILMAGRTVGRRRQRPVRSPALGVLSTPTAFRCQLIAKCCWTARSRIPAGNPGSLCEAGPDDFAIGMDAIATFGRECPYDTKSASAFGERVLWPKARRFG